MWMVFKVNYKITDNQKKLVTHILILFGIVLVAGLAITLLDSGEARTCVWDGGDGASALASDPDNWDTDTAPVAGDDILFDGLHLVNASADDACTWDLSTNSFGTFTIASAYSGTITQSSDMYIQGFSMSGGTFTGAISKWMYLSNGIFSQTAGTLTGDNLRLNLINSSLNAIVGVPQNLKLDGVCYINTTGEKFSRMFTNTGTLIILNQWDVGLNTPPYTVSNTGTITGRLNIWLYSSDVTINAGIGTDTRIYARSSASGNRVVTLSDDAVGITNIQSSHATYTCTLDPNGHSLTASSITIGTRGILSNSAGTVSNVTCAAFTSTSGTFNHVNIILQMNGGTLTSTAGEQFETLLLNGTVDLVNAVNITEDMRFVNVDPDYAQIDVYLDTVYHSTISSPYSFGTGTQIGASYSYLPDVQITMSQFYEDVDFSIYAYISSTLPVEYNITGTAASFLSYHEGRIVGMPPDIGNYTYIITATHESGSKDILTGYILVGSLSTAEYSFDMIWGLILWLVISAFMLLGLLLNIPLIQIVAFMGTIGSIVASLRIPNFEAFLMIFALGNSVLFFIGMIRYRR